MAKSIGDQELQLLRQVAERGGATVAEAVESFGAPRGLARSTVLTMMERLRRKGHLRRRAVDGIYRYSTAVSAGEVEQGAISSFVEKTLGGSLSPFVAYLAERADVDERELAELETLVARLKSKQEERT
ncbi:MAG: BlaI/MecI/CopY family transcriptional regulator [Thermoanaerobaculia bacterium]